MGCDIYVFRKDASSESSDHGEIFWDVKSWDLGYEFGCVGIDNHYQKISEDQLRELAQDLIDKGKEDCGEYPDGALKALLEDLDDLDEDLRNNSCWFLTMDY